MRLSALLVVLLLSGCDVLDPPDVVSGCAVDATDGAPVEDALVRVGLYSCRKFYLPGVIDCPIDRYQSTSFGQSRTDADGTFRVEYDLTGRDVHAEPCVAPTTPQDCRDVGGSAALPETGEVVVEVVRRTFPPRSGAE